MTRADAMAAFVAGAGLDPTNIRPLAADASFRQYFRVTGDPAHVLMDAPPDKEDIIPFMAIARHLNGLGLSAPQTIAHDYDQGFLLLEDLGDDTFTHLLKRGTSEEDLYRAAIDVLLALHQQTPPATIALPDGPVFTVPPYDDAALLTEVQLLTDWYVPALGITLPADAQHAFDQLWQAAFPLCRIGAEVLVLRDYHVDNLMMLAGCTNNEAVGLLDFQDALVGPAAYDLVSLLQDCRYHVPDDLEQAMLANYLAARPDLDADAFRTAYTIMGAQRQTKIIGIFTRLWQRDGKPSYLRMIPYLWDLLERDLQHPALADIKAWLDTHIPAESRRAPLPGSPS